MTSRPVTQTDLVDQLESSLPFSKSEFSNVSELRPENGYRYKIPERFQDPDKTSSDPQDQFIEYKRFECWIDEIYDGIIYARGKEVKDFETQIQFNIPIDSVEDNDRELVHEGAVFVLLTGTLVKVKGQHVNKSTIKFRRSLKPTLEEVDKLDERQKYLARALGIDV